MDYAYQWQGCDGGSGADLAGAAEPAYTLKAADVGATLRVVVAATNPGGNASAASEATAKVAAAAPAVSDKPTVSGRPGDGETPNASNGAWDGTPPIDSAYQRQRCHGGPRAD